MTTRKAILIGAPDADPENPLPGVEKDIQSVKDFLLSNQGGKWYEKEITILINPDKSLVEHHLLLASNADYVFILCAGHGEHQYGENIDDTVIHINEKETMSISSINPKNRRHLVISDTCRQLKRIGVAAMLSMQKSLALVSESKDYINYREIFDKSLLNCSEGRIVAYSCDINQSAGEDYSGGYFTQSLINSPTHFSPKDNSYDIVNIKQAFDYAKKATYNKNAPQNPVFVAGRRNDFYPFAIVKM